MFEKKVVQPPKCAPSLFPNECMKGKIGGGAEKFDILEFEVNYQVDDDWDEYFFSLSKASYNIQEDL